MKISRKLAAARNQRQPGPQLSLNLERLGGVYMSNAEIRELVQYSVIGPVVNKPKWAHFRPWKSTSQTIVIRINCPNDYIASIRLLLSVFCTLQVFMARLIFRKTMSSHLHLWMISLKNVGFAWILLWETVTAFGITSCKYL
ncbi:hypothetical protein ANCDUO_15107 [Ancylostoma duodenale]|uniref:Uncharacterized protein n=1 Tax=Ancylostoma duodenale TaxID=51022 RepID=A0A0C2GCI8_9BILA|nr:hypothetical protein ANCDUO_15107 [Ancylostoma duodenale]